MDGRQIPSTTPTFSMELANLCRLGSSDPQARPITQYPSVDFSYYNSSRRSQTAPTTSNTPHFIPVAARNGSKRIRVSELNIGPGPSPEALLNEKLRLAIDRSLNQTTSFIRDLCGSPLVAGVDIGLAVYEPERDPPEMYDDNEEEEEEEESEHNELTTNSCDDDDDERAKSDPCEVLGSNVFGLILSFLDCKSLARCLGVSAAWQRCAQDDFLWASACHQLWDEKNHIHPTALHRSTPRLKAFQISLADSQRTRIEAHDLCTFVWELRYKEVNLAAHIVLLQISITKFPVPVLSRTRKCISFEYGHSTITVTILVEPGSDEKIVAIVEGPSEQVEDAVF